MRIDLVLQDFQLRTQMPCFHVCQPSGREYAVIGQPERETTQSDKKDHQVRARSQIEPEPIIEDFFIPGYIGFILEWTAAHQVQLEQHICRSPYKNDQSQPKRKASIRRLVEEAGKKPFHRAK